MDPQRYLAHRRRYEIAVWLLFFVMNITANSITQNMELARVDSPLAGWKPWIWETTSALLWLGIIPVMLVFDRHFPIGRAHSRWNWLWHLLFTLPVSIMHVAGMVALRKLAYWRVGEYYDFGPWGSEFLYEYLKDIRIYAGFLAIVYLYRLVLRRWQGEAEFLTEGHEAESAEPVVDRFLVRKLGREFLVKVEDIDWVESAANYVTLHVGERLYPLRETMSGIEQKLKSQGFARVHRSAIINLDRVREIEPFDTGDARAHLVTGAAVPVSRRYRQELKERLR